MPKSPGASRRSIEGLMESLARWRQWTTQRSAAVDRIVLLAALGLFGAAGVFSYARLPPLELHPRWALYALAVAGLAYVSLIANAGEFALSAWLLGARVRVRQALGVSVLASAANLLPLPGSVAVRTSAMSRLGLGVRRGFAATAVVGMAWLATAFLMAGLLSTTRAPVFATVSLAAGLIGWAVAVQVALRLLRSEGVAGKLLFLFGLELFSVGATAVRMYVLLRMLGVSATGMESAGIALAAMLASAVGFAPGGLGLRELLTAGVATFGDVAPSVGIAVSILDRIVFGVALGLVSVVMLRRGTDVVSPRRGADGARPEASRRPHCTSGERKRREKAQKLATLVSRRRGLEGARILDIGTGAGVIASELARLAGRRGQVWSVDTSDLRTERDAYSFRLVEGPKLPFEGGSFDVVISNHVMEHVGEAADQSVHLREMRRVLSGDGVGYIAVPNRWGILEPHFHLPFLSWLPRRLSSWYVRLFGRGDWYDVYPPSRRRLLSALRDAGLAAEDCTLEAVRVMGEVETVGTLTRWFLRIPTGLLKLGRPVVPTFVYVVRRGAPEVSD